MYFRLASESDIPVITELHSERFTDSYLSTRRSLLLSLYEYFINSSNFKVIILEDQKLLGCMVLRVGNKFKLSLSYVRVLIFTPLLKSLELLCTRERKRFFINEMIHIQSIYTIENNKGYGSLLLKKAEHEAKILERGVITLDTDFLDNTKVIDFYERNGYNRDYVYLKGKKPMLKMYKLLYHES